MKVIVDRQGDIPPEVETALLAEIAIAIARDRGAKRDYEKRFAAWLRRFHLG